MDSKMYFGDYHSGRLQNQRLLCRVLKKHGYSIETDDANPMTIRLLVTHDNLCMIEKLAAQWKLIEYPEIIVSESRFRGPMVSGALSCEIFAQPCNHKETFNFIDVHKALFGFFSNLNSAMDRLAYELKSIYNVHVSKIYWHSFYKEISSEYSLPWLKHIVKCQEANWIIKCRNRILHDGILRFELKNSICLQDLKGNWLPMETECFSAFWKIVDTIDLIYGGILVDIEAGRLPLNT